jgi:hypothetical protein
MVNASFSRDSRRRDDTLEWLEHAYKDGRHSLADLIVEHLLYSLSSNDRYRESLKKMGLTDQ